MTKRYEYYMRRTITSGRSEQLRFLETHYREAGVSPSLLSGMPLLEAHELVNKWNRDQYKQVHIYWLA